MENDTHVWVVIIFRIIGVFVAQTQQLLPPTLLLPNIPPPSTTPQSWEDLLSLTWLMEFFENAYPFTLDKGLGNLMCFSWNRRTWKDPPPPLTERKTSLNRLVGGGGGFWTFEHISTAAADEASRPRTLWSRFVWAAGFWKQSDCWGWLLTNPATISLQPGRGGEN